MDISRRLVGKGGGGPDGPAGEVGVGTGAVVVTGVGAGELGVRDGIVGGGADDDAPPEGLRTSSMANKFLESSRNKSPFSLRDINKSCF